MNTNAESKIALVVLATFSGLKSDACPKKKKKKKKGRGAHGGIKVRGIKGGGLFENAEGCWRRNQ